MENKDISLTYDGGRFTLRAVALIMDRGRLLAVRDRVHDSYYTVGGRIRTGESSAQAAEREAFEETGRRFAAERLVFVQERFHDYNGSAHHEISFHYIMKGDATGIESGVYTDQSAETLHWLPIEQLAQVKLVPQFLKSALRQLPEGVTHVVSREGE